MNSTIKTSLAPATLLHYGDVRYQAPQPADVRAVIELLGLSADAVATLVGVKDGRAVRRWIAPVGSKTHANIDYAAWRLLLLEAGLVKFVKRGRAKAKPKGRISLSTTNLETIYTDP